jgi:Asp-tRNA(Asn)/Glu-tRNA(Gln) amidotransferase A subunit family amidase
MGSDTGGSIRGPALTNGLFGNHPSQDSVSLEGAIPLSTSMDTSGTLARDPKLWSAVNKVLYADTTKEYNSFPNQVYLVADYNITDLQQGASEGDPSAIALYDFITGLTKLLNATIDNLSLDVVWNKTTPHSIVNTTLADAISAIYGNLTTYEQWESFGKGYLEAYTSIHGGDFPYVAYNTLHG